MFGFGINQCGEFERLYCSCQRRDEHDWYDNHEYMVILQVLFQVYNLNNGINSSNFWLLNLKYLQLLIVVQFQSHFYQLIQAKILLEPTWLYFYVEERNIKQTYIILHTFLCSAFYQLQIIDMWMILISFVYLYLSLSRIDFREYFSNMGVDFFSFSW